MAPTLGEALRRREAGAVDTASSPPLAEILRRDTNILTATRSLEPAVEAALQGVASGEPFEHAVRVDTQHVDVAPLLASVSNPAARQFLQRDIAWLVRQFGAVMGKNHLHVQLSVLRGDGCPKFHADNVTVRLLCTYVGLGTEWITNADVVRDNLGRIDAGFAEANRSVLRHGGAVQHCGPGDVLLLKGEAFEGNAGSGAVHRSPPIQPEGLSRLVLKIDEEACGC